MKASVATTEGLSSQRSSSSLRSRINRHQLTANSQELNAYIAEAIAHYSAMDDVLALKMPGAGGGGYLALVVTDAKSFVEQHSEAFELHIRRE